MRTRGNVAARHALGVCMVLALAGGHGCEHHDYSKEKGPSFASPSAAPPAAAAPAKAVLTGFVRLADGATLPSYPAEAMERVVTTHGDPVTFPPICTPPKKTDRMPVRLTPDGKLIGVMIAASEFKRSPERAAKTYDVVIKDCRLTPSLVVAMKGDSLSIKNQVNFPLMPELGAVTLSKTLMPGQDKEVKLSEAGVKPVLCGFIAPCGRTDVVVLNHPVYAVTGEDGSFRIDDFPADENVKIDAWHPLFNSQELSLRVERGQTKSVELTIAPLGQPAPSAPAATPTQK
ncbi:MAG TPA: hypothetical protein VF331_08455 [Polyangiales bacterium]